jgi:hypothetical protein
LWKKIIFGLAWRRIYMIMLKNVTCVKSIQSWTSN